MKNLMTKTTRLFLGMMIILLSSFANAQGADGEYDNNYVPKPFYRDYDCAWLETQGCSCTVWNKMVEQYVGKRIDDRGVEVEGLVKNNMRVAVVDNGGAGSCIQNALQQINNAAKGLAALMSMFSGSFDFSSIFSTLFDSLLSNALEYACSEVNRVTGDWAGRTLGSAGTQLAGLKGTSAGIQLPPKINTNPAVLEGLTSAAPAPQQSSQGSGVFNKAVNSVKCLFGNC